MGLKDLKLRTEEVEVPGGDKFVVRGLSFSDLSGLYTKYAGEVSAFFELLKNSGTDGVDVEQAASMAASLIHSAPALAAEAIAIASGDASDFEIALQLPFPVQAEALKKIGLCTFGSEGTAKKFAQTVSSLVKNQASPKNP